MSENVETIGTQEPFITDMDRYLFAQGTNERAYEKLGAHVIEKDGVKGVHFAVWAPAAHYVAVIGDFNDWDKTVNPMEAIDNGIWICFIPEIDYGATYKYHIDTPTEYSVDKSDPYGFATQFRPETASIVTDIDSYKWQDSKWMENRKDRQGLDKPISIYEVHLGSWKRNEKDEYMTYRELADDLVSYVQEIGFTHIELLPIAEHPYDGSWGYQVTGYFAPTSRFGTPQEFQYFVDACHQAGIGVIVDWVPAHFPKDSHGLGYFDGTHLYEHADPRQGEHKDWGTFIFNFGRNEVQSFIFSNAVFWLDKYHIDGLRVDAVASMLYLDYSREAGEWVPNSYGGRENLEAIHVLRKFNEIVHGIYPDIMTFAEESTAWPMVSRPVYVGGLGFDFKWNMGWMHDTISYMKTDSLFRRYHHNSITFSIWYAFNENFILPFSHDEVVHMKGSMIEKMSGVDWWQKFANLRLCYAYMYGHPGKKLLFMGHEFAQWAEWNFDLHLDWNLLAFPTHQGVSDLVRDLNHLYKNEPSLHEDDFSPNGFEWIDCNDSDNSVLAFIRFDKERNSQIVFVCNFTPVISEGYQLGVDEPGFYYELINSDDTKYGGSGINNGDGIETQQVEHHGREHSLYITIPPLATIAFKRQA